MATRWKYGQRPGADTTWWRPRPPPAPWEVLDLADLLWSARNDEVVIVTDREGVGWRFELGLAAADPHLKGPILHLQKGEKSVALRPVRDPDLAELAAMIAWGHAARPDALPPIEPRAWRALSSRHPLARRLRGRLGTDSLLLVRQPVDRVISPGPEASWLAIRDAWEVPETPEERWLVLAHWSDAEDERWGQVRQVVSPIELLDACVDGDLASEAIVVAAFVVGQLSSAVLDDELLPAGIAQVVALLDERGIEHALRPKEGNPDPDATALTLRWSAQGPVWVHPPLAHMDVATLRDLRATCAELPLMPEALLETVDAAIDARVMAAEAAAEAAAERARLRVEAARVAAEEQARLEAERAAVKEEARLQAERAAAEEQARLQAERRAAEDQARHDAERAAAEERARLDAERATAEERARLEAEKAAAEEQARLQAEKAAAEEQARLGAERAAAEERARLEAEEAAAEEQARLDAERAAAEEQARLEAEEAAAEEQARLEAEKAAAEEQARLEAEKAAAEEQARLDAEKAAAEEQARLEAEEAAAEEQARLEAEEAAAEEQARHAAERRAANELALERECARLKAEKAAAEERARLEDERRAAAKEGARLEAEQAADLAAKRVREKAKAADRARQEAEQAARARAQAIAPAAPARMPPATEPARPPPSPDRSPATPLLIGAALLVAAALLWWLWPAASDSPPAALRSATTAAAERPGAAEASAPPAPQGMADVDAGASARSADVGATARAPRAADALDQAQAAKEPTPRPKAASGAPTPRFAALPWVTVWGGGPIPVETGVVARCNRYGDVELRRGDKTRFIICDLFHTEPGRPRGNLRRKVCASDPVRCVDLKKAELASLPAYICTPKSGFAYGLLKIADKRRAIYVSETANSGDLQGRATRQEWRKWCGGYAPYVFAMEKLR